jgi:uncharacterized protein involved in exopolysaccharide biosynthesis
VTPSERVSNTRVSQDTRREIDVRALWHAVCRHKLIVAATTVVFVALALYLALTATFIFRGEVTVAQVQETGAGGLSGIAGQFGGLASLAGLNLNQSSQQQERQAVLESRRLVEEFIKRNGVLPLMARNAKTPPTLWTAVEKFRKASLIITEDKLKGTTTVTIDWTDPATAARWANAFVGLANDLVRMRAIDDASRNIDYLNKQIAKTNVIELQRVMYNLVEQETKTLMLANGRTEYAFTIVDPAVTPEKRVSPKRTLMVASGLVVGLLFGAFIAIVYDVVQRRRREAAAIAQ